MRRFRVGLSLALVAAAAIAKTPDAARKPATVAPELAARAYEAANLPYLCSTFVQAGDASVCEGRHQEFYLSAIVSPWARPQFPPDHVGPRGFGDVTVESEFDLVRLRHPAFLVQVILRSDGEPQRRCEINVALDRDLRSEAYPVAAATRSSVGAWWLDGWLANDEQQIVKFLRSGELPPAPQKQSALGGGLGLVVMRAQTSAESKPPGARPSDYLVACAREDCRAICGRRAPPGYVGQAIMCYFVVPDALITNVPDPAGDSAPAPETFRQDGPSGSANSGASAGAPAPQDLPPQICGCRYVGCFVDPQNVPDDPLCHPGWYDI